MGSGRLSGGLGRLSVGSGWLSIRFWRLYGRLSKSGRTDGYVGQVGGFVRWAGTSGVSGK